MDKSLSALVNALDRDINSLRQGIRWMECGIWKTGEFMNGLIVDQTAETLAFYRRKVAEIERQFEDLCDLDTAQ